MPRGAFPGGYVMGLGCNNASETFVRDVNAWMRSAREQCDRVLRNVFGHNILNDRNLDLKVGDSGWRTGSTPPATAAASNPSPTAPTSGPSAKKTPPPTTSTGNTPQ